MFISLSEQKGEEQHWMDDSEVLK